MKRSIPVSVGVAITAVIAILIVALFWFKLNAPPATKAVGAAASSAPPADLQKNPDPRDLAKQYGYSVPPGQR